MGIYQGNKLMSGGGGGPSPYEIAKQNGYIGTESEFNQLLAALDQNVTEQELNNKADLVNGKVPAEQVDAYTKTEADTLLQNKANTADFQSHTTSKSNPHGVTATQTGAYTKGETDTLLQKKVDKDRAVNPNLLDNWYFGNPVDQRGGYVVPPNTTIYDDTDCTVVYNIVGSYTKIFYVNEKYGEVTWDGTVGAKKYVKRSDMIRGYTGEGYGIDRWKLLTSQCTVTIDNDGITLHRNGGDQWIYAQPLEPELVTALTGKSVVISTLTDTGLVELPVSSAFTAEQSMVSTSGTCIWLSTAGYLFVGTTADSVKLKAVKLELGTQQTLAHQDENGKWALNEIPDYGEQLARCQRYYYDSRFVSDKNSDGSHSRGGHAIVLDTASSFLISTYGFPVTMRTAPSIKIYSFIGTENRISYWASGVDVPDVTATINEASVGASGFNCVVSSSTLGENVYAFHIVANAEL